MENILLISHIFQLISFKTSEIIEKYEKQGKYLPMLHKAKCDNYFIRKCFLTSNFLNTTKYKQEKANNLSVNLTYVYFQAFVSFVFPYFNSNILCYVSFLCIPCFFVINLFLNVLYSFKSLIFPNI